MQLLLAIFYNSYQAKVTESIEYGMRFYQGDDCIQRLHVDSASELAKAARALGIMIDPSPPYEPQSNGAIEVFVGIIKQDTRSVLLHSGLGHKWWPHAMEYVTFAYNLETNAPYKPCEKP